MDVPTKVVYPLVHSNDAFDPENEESEWAATTPTDLPEIDPRALQTQNSKVAYQEDFLVYTHRQCEKLKNFHEEVHALKDVATFLRNAVINLADETEDTTVESVLDTLIKKILSIECAQDVDTMTKLIKISKTNSPVKRENIFEHFSIPYEVRVDIRNHLFALTNETFKSERRLKFGITPNADLIAQSVQGVTVNSGDTIFQKNWICLHMTSNYVKQQRVGITRTCQPINMGHNSENVRFVILILVPAKHSALSSAMQVSRTFGTLFNNGKFLDELSHT